MDDESNQLELACAVYGLVIRQHARYIISALCAGFWSAYCRAKGGRRNERLSLPVEHQALGLAAEAIQSNVVLHQREHLYLVRDVDRRCDAAPAGDRQADEATSCSDL